MAGFCCDSVSFAEVVMFLSARAPTSKNESIRRSASSSSRCIEVIMFLGLMLNRERWPKWSSKASDGDTRPGKTLPSSQACVDNGANATRTKATSSAGVHARKGTPIALLVRCFNDGDIGEL